MRKLLFVFALSAFVFASCGKKTEPVVEPTPAVVETPVQEVKPAPVEVQPTPAPTPAPKKKEVKPEPEVKKVDVTTKKAPAPTGSVKTAPVQPKVLTLEEKLKIFDQLSPAEQKEVLKQVEEQKNAAVGTQSKTKKGKK